MEATAATGLSDKGDLKDSCFRGGGWVGHPATLEWVEKCLRGKNMVVS